MLKRGKLIKKVARNIANSVIDLKFRLGEEFLIYLSLSITSII